MAIFGFVLMTFVVPSLAIYGLCARIARPSPEERGKLFLLTAPLGPFLVSWLVALLFSSPSHQRAGVVIPAVCVVLVLLLLLGFREWTAVLRTFFGSLGRRPASFNAIGILAGLLVAVATYQIVALPMLENDALEYMAVARHILESGTLSVYPVLTADPRTGLFAGSSHPPAYHMMLVWGFMWTGAETFVAARLYALFCLAATIGVLAYVLRPRGGNSLALGILLLLATPLYMQMAVTFHIDALRLLAFLIGAVAIADLIRNPGPRRAIVTGIALGFTIYAHSIGLLALPFAGVAYLLLGPGTFWDKVRLGCVFGTVALAVGGLQYGKNLVQFGAPLQDSMPVWDLPQVDFGSDLRYRRDLMLWTDRLGFGVLRGFFEMPIFGLIFWFLVPVVFILARRWRTSTVEDRVFIVWIGAFFTLSALSASLGSDLIIKNPRYVLTIVPLVVCLAAPLLNCFQAPAAFNFRKAMNAVPLLGRLRMSTRGE